MIWQEPIRQTRAVLIAARACFTAILKAQYDKFIFLWQLLEGEYNFVGASNKASLHSANKSDLAMIDKAGKSSLRCNVCSWNLAWWRRPNPAAHTICIWHLASRKETKPTSQDSAALYAAEAWLGDSNSNMQIDKFSFSVFQWLDIYTT